jgi:hypothetical protein
MILHVLPESYGCRATGQSRTVLSERPDASHCPSGENATDGTRLVGEQFCGYDEMLEILVDDVSLFRWTKQQKGHRSMEKLEWPRQLPRREFERRAKQILQEIQASLLPEHASEVVAINVENGQYTLGRTTVDAVSAFKKRWPNQLAYLIRADGGPVAKFRGM